ncbi:MAG: hypothetical protein WBZ08_12995, partial [Pseudolabrys sp.]
SSIPIQRNLRINLAHSSDEHQRFRGSRCWKAMKMAMPITDTTTSIATMAPIADTLPAMNDVGNR